MKAILAAALLSVLVNAVLCEHWALLVAGSNGYYNYRHQADVCHAYHVLHNHGIPDERIVVMMYDDIAHSDHNPIKGNIINEPNGKNLYPGVLKDYTGRHVTPEVFLKVLTGDQDGVEKLTGSKGKVIKSGPNDHVFVYFADHGAPGLIAFPDSELHAVELNKAIVKMHENKQYKKMVFYIEACESGSMFDNILRKDINVYATTAANPDESSYAFYYDKKRKTYLGDLYSIRWLQDSDAENLNTETLAHQFNLVKKETNLSHVMQYGDLSMGKEFVGEFQGNNLSKVITFRQDKTDLSYAEEEAIPSEYVPIETLRRKVESSTGRERVEAEKAFRTLMKRNRETMKFFQSIGNAVSTEHTFQQLYKTSIRFTDFKCYKQAIKTIKTTCPGLNLVQNDFALRNLRILANLCETNVPMEKIMLVIKAVARRSQIC